MAIGTPTSLGSSTNTAAGTTKTHNTTAAVPSGALVIVCASWGNSSVVTGTLSGGGLTWTQDKVQDRSTGYRHSYSVFSAPAPAGLSSGTTLTLTLSASNDGSNIAALYCTGLDVSGTRKDTSSGADASTSSWTTGSSSTTNADDLVVGGSVIDSSASSTPASTTPTTTELFDFTNPNAWAHTVVYKIQTASGSQSLAGTWTSSASEASAFVAYKADGGGSQNLTPGTISSGAQLFAPTLAPGSVTITPGTISAGNQVFAPTLAQVVQPGFVASGEQLFGPTLVPGSVTVTPGHLASGEQVFAPTLQAANTLAPARVESTAQLFAPTLVPGSVTVTPGFLASTAQVFTPGLVGGDVSTRASQLLTMGVG